MGRSRSVLTGAWRQTPSHWLLLLLCVVPPVAESVLVLILIPGSPPTLSSQASALAPLGVFHDLRWLGSYANSWPTFAALVAAILVGRGVLTALSVRLAWPATARPPAMGRLIFRGVGATALAALLLAPSVALLFALGVVPVSWLFIGGYHWHWASLWSSIPLP